MHSTNSPLANFSFIESVALSGIAVSSGVWREFGTEARAQQRCGSSLRKDRNPFR